MKNKTIGPIVEGPGGLSMPERIARRIETLASKLPKDFVYRRIARKSDEFALDPGERTDVSVITTDALDRDGEVVLPAGIDWSGYNRVVTFSHRYDQLPVGSNWWMRARGNGLIAKTHYPPKPADWGAATPWLPSAVLHLMQQPVATCTGKSIGFLPLSIREATADERARRPELSGVPIIDKAAGLEYAVAPVPCNPEAQMQAVAKGKELGLIDDVLERLLISLPDAPPDRECEKTFPFLRPATLRFALERQLETLRPLVTQQVQQHIREVFCAATGRVC